MSVGELVDRVGLLDPDPPEDHVLKRAGELLLGLHFRDEVGMHRAVVAVGGRRREQAGTVANKFEALAWVPIIVGVKREVESVGSVLIVGIDSRGPQAPT